VRVESDDIVHVAGASANDFLLFTVQLDGVVTLSANPLAGGGFLSSAGYTFETSGGVELYQDVVSCLNVFPCSSGTATTATVKVPLGPDGNGASAVVDQLLIDQFGCTGTSLYPCLLTGDFAHSARIGDATVVDASGNQVLGTVITSDSGYDYTQSVQPGSVPESSSIIFLVLGSIPFVQSRFRRRLAIR
jgi:hypothetical protein